jgi:hypothetical protein
MNKICDINLICVISRSPLSTVREILDDRCTINIRYEVTMFNVFRVNSVYASECQFLMITVTIIICLLFSDIS